MNTNIKNEVTAAGNKAQYDAQAKRLLGNKYILAHILKETIPEFKGEEMSAILPCIEDDVKIASIPVEPGETNRREEKEWIQGDNTEDNVPDEGTGYFDIIYQGLADAMRPSFQKTHAMTSMAGTAEKMCHGHNRDQSERRKTLCIKRHPILSRPEGKHPPLRSQKSVYQ